MINIPERITQIDYELKSIEMIRASVALAGGIGAVFFLAKEKKFLGKVGYFLLGGIVANIPTNLIYSSKVTKLLAEKENLKRQLEI
jgi:hypothetical protein